ncbi:anti-sigma B factor antagonist/stage II sporulation protein AA (anti-sigma F factor antagonist) [Jatrophihabitans endophyticus]|uniref:Anti-sigma factor antagonist n=1 Tax=Jatrophihabitans endophyticus TaxID=1206085 RepID=A0A1M5IRX3_9ACTN|nr:STAS domain-containing protein [Jatrophihabitans endophyticus]SHG31092.1 anti-sigma B factor antagonist/stage II sporulation protein AA (anti-sigma F factor antagonist) [Jatrophihabitans endophyticus]
MDITARRADSVATLTVHGTMDAREAYRVYETAAAEAEAGATLVAIDLSGVDFIDSVGLGMLVRTQEELTRDYKSELTLLNTSPTVLRLLELTGLQDHFRLA